MTQLASLKVQLGDFCGSLPELVEQVRKGVVELSEVPLALLAEQVAQLLQHDAPSAERQAESVVAVLQLLWWKLGALLPQEDALVDDEALTGQLLSEEDVLLWREQAELLRETWGKQSLMALPGQSLNREMHVEAMLLAESLSALLGDREEQAQSTTVVKRSGPTLGEMLGWLTVRLKKMERFVWQREIERRPRHEVAVSLLALLELERRGQVALQQNERFGDIGVTVGS